jgi:predicted hydrolase (HD superfamily)
MIEVTIDSIRVSLMNYQRVVILKEKGVSEEIRRAILGHADYTGIPRDTLLAKALYACDELAGFITACALVRPVFGKGLF